MSEPSGVEIERLFEVDGPAAPIPLPEPLEDLYDGTLALDERVVFANFVTSIDGVAATATDDDSVRYRLGRSIARMEAATSTPEMFGRVAIAQTMRDVTPDLMDILGTASGLPVGTEGAADDGGAEYIFRLAGPTGIYGGTLEVFRNMIAQHALGLGRPAYAPPAVKAK